MTKTFKFKTNKDNTGSIFTINNKLFYEPNYSKIIDNIILSDIKKKNDYLYNSICYKNCSDCPFNSSTGTSNTKIKFIDAANFLANYKKRIININSTPYVIGKMYMLNDGTRIVFYEDEIQIDGTFYNYSDFNNIFFLNSITPSIKKIIINIYTTASTKISINI